MPSVGFSELALLFIIGLLILGPERLPRVASQLGRWVGRARRTANQLRYQLEREVSLTDLDPLRKPNPPRPAARTAPAPASETAPGSATVTAAAAAAAVPAAPAETDSDSHPAAETVARAAEAAALPSTDAADGSETIRKS